MTPSHPPTAPEAARNWPEDFPHENGLYTCVCRSCGGHFMGHKRRVTCRVCASPPVAETPSESGEVAGLSDTELRIAVAKHLGYRVEPSGRGDFPFSMFWPGGAHGGYWATEKLAWGQNVPHFEWSLDAMAEAEKALETSEQRGEYLHQLDGICGRARSRFATARQRAQAFCAVMGIKLP